MYNTAKFMTAMYLLGKGFYVDMLDKIRVVVSSCPKLTEDVGLTHYKGHQLVRDQMHTDGKEEPVLLWTNRNNCAKYIL